MNTIKSITPVRTSGNGNNGNWVVRMRLNDGSELFGGLGAGYTLAQAEAFARNQTDNVPLRNPMDDTYSVPYQPLPSGVTISSK
jgi:hypothetical protein